MTNIRNAEELLAQITKDDIKLGELKKIAKQIKMDHQLAQALWASEHQSARLLSVLIMDKKCLTQSAIEDLAKDLLQQSETQRNQISEWLLANQLTKSKKTNDLLEQWQDHASPVLRRLFWYHQARLRWVGQTPPGNTDELVVLLEKDLAKEQPEVQWAMNFCAGQIGVHQPEYRDRCTKLGERSGLYKNDKVSKGCTPSYLPKFIEIEVAKRS
jgi:3-methyladenine DNA glycosylase AlkD